MKFSTNFAAMLRLVGRIKSSLNCNPSLELHDITHAQYTYTYLFADRISKLVLHSFQSYGCVRITSWITLVQILSKSRTEGKLNRSKIFVLRCHFKNKVLHENPATKRLCKGRKVVQRKKFSSPFKVSDKPFTFKMCVSQSRQDDTVVYVTTYDIQAPGLGCTTSMVKMSQFGRDCIPNTKY